MKVKFCENNQWKDTVINMLAETHPNVKISTKKCLGKCHKCKVHPISMVDKEILVGKNEKDLCNMIINKL